VTCTYINVQALIRTAAKSKHLDTLLQHFVSCC